jgi:hypothetical protein
VVHFNELISHCHGYVKEPVKNLRLDTLPQFKRVGELGFSLPLPPDPDTLVVIFKRDIAGEIFTAHFFFSGGELAYIVSNTKERVVGISCILSEAERPDCIELRNIIAKIVNNPNV